MNDPTVETLAQRLDRLEREVRWWRGIGALALICAATFLLTGQALPKTRIVEAEQFVVKDRKGVARAQLRVGSDNSAGLILYDQEGWARVWLAVRRPEDEGLPVLWFKDPKGGRDRAAIGYHLDANKYVGPTIRLFDAQGKVIWSAP